MGLRNKLDDIKSNKVFQAGERFVKRLESIEEDLVSLQEAFNNNTKVMVKLLESIDNKLAKLEKAQNQDEDS